MTYREAIELTEDSGTLLNSNSKTRHEWEKLVIESLELRVDKPIVVKNNVLTCINCGHILAQGKEQVDFIKANIYTVHCTNCGQLINFDNIKKAVPDFDDKYTMEDLLEIDYFG